MQYRTVVTQKFGFFDRVQSSEGSVLEIVLKYVWLYAHFNHHYTKHTTAIWRVVAVQETIVAWCV